jgi:undecaprenyl diphosphate synthase
MFRQHGRSQACGDHHGRQRALGEEAPVAALRRASSRCRNGADDGQGCCLERGIEYLTLFAFSSENWRRPQDEVSLLMQLFVRVLKEEVRKLDRNGVRLRVIGDLARFEPDLQALIDASEQRTAANIPA